MSATILQFKPKTEPVPVRTKRTIKTFRRDKLQRLVEAGRIMMIDAYRFDDMHGETQTTGPMPVAMIPEDRKTEPGICYMFPSDFTSKSGYCWQNEDGSITLSIHSNRSLTLKVLP